MLKVSSFQVIHKLNFLFTNKYGKLFCLHLHNEQRDKSNKQRKKSDGQRTKINDQQAESKEKQATCKTFHLFHKNQSINLYFYQ